MNEPQPEEKLSGTLAGSIGRFLKALGRVPLAIRGVSAAVAAGGGVILALGLGLYLFVGDLRTFAVILMGLGGLLLLIAMLVSTKAVVAAATGRQGRYGANTAVMTVAFAGIAVLVNFLAFQSNARLDVTATKQFSLAPRSVELLRKLENPVRAIGFFRSIDAQQQVLTAQVDDLLHEFKRRSNKFSYRFVDPDTDTVTAQEYGVTQYGTIIFEDTGTGRRQAVFVVPGRPVLEQDFITGLLIATGKEQKRVYFLTGHGEADILDGDSDGAGGLAFEGLLRDNYLADSLNLLELAEVPKNTAVLIIAGPKKDFQPEEVTRLDSYLKLGGRMVVMVDPDAPQTVRDFLTRWGVTLQQGQVIDVGRNVGGDPKIPLLQRGQYNTQSLPELVGVLDTTFYPGLGGLVPTRDKMDNIGLAGLAVTSSLSWLVKDPTQTAPQPSDTIGPFTVAVAVKAAGPLDGPPDPSATEAATLVVFADSDFATNRYFYAFSNGDFFLNAVNWLAGDISLVSIRPKPVAFRELVLTRTERDFIRYSTWLLLPLAMLGVAGLAWWRRR